MFTLGMIVKLRYRKEENPLFVVVANSPIHTVSPTGKFYGTVILNLPEGLLNEIHSRVKAGQYDGGWNIEDFVLSSVEELKQHL